MQVVLIVEPHLCDPRKLREVCGAGSIPVQVASPLLATYALHAVQFDVVVVPREQVDERAYAALFSTMRLVAPASILVSAPPVAREQAAACHLPADDAQSRRQHEEAAGATVC